MAVGFQRMKVLMDLMSWENPADCLFYLRIETKVNERVKSNGCLSEHAGDGEQVEGLRTWGDEPGGLRDGNTGIRWPDGKEWYDLKYKLYSLWGLWGSHHDHNHQTYLSIPFQSWAFSLFRTMAFPTCSGRGLQESERKISFNFVQTFVWSFLTI